MSSHCNMKLLPLIITTESLRRMKIVCLGIVLFLAVVSVILLIAFSSHVGASSGKMSRLLATIMTCK